MPPRRSDSVLRAGHHPGRAAAGRRHLPTHRARLRHRTAPGGRFRAAYRPVSVRPTGRSLPLRRARVRHLSDLSGARARAERARRAGTRTTSTSCSTRATTLDPDGRHRASRVRDPRCCRWNDCAAGSPTTTLRDDSTVAAQHARALIDELMARPATRYADHRARPWGHRRHRSPRRPDNRFYPWVEAMPAVIYSTWWSARQLGRQAERTDQFWLADTQPGLSTSTATTTSSTGECSTWPCCCRTRIATSPRTVTVTNEFYELDRSRSSPPAGTT